MLGDVAELLNSESATAINDESSLESHRLLIEKDQEQGEGVEGEHGEASAAPDSFLETENVAVNEESNEDSNAPYLFRGAVNVAINEESNEESSEESSNSIGLLDFSGGKASLVE